MSRPTATPTPRSPPAGGGGEAPAACTTSGAARRETAHSRKAPGCHGTADGSALSSAWHVVASHVFGRHGTAAARLSNAETRAARQAVRDLRDAVDAAVTTIHVTTARVHEMSGGGTDPNQSACRLLGSLQSLRAIHFKPAPDGDPTPPDPDHGLPKPHEFFLHLCQLCVPLLPRRGKEITSLLLGKPPDDVPLDSAAVTALGQAFPNLQRLQLPLLQDGWPERLRPGSVAHGLHRIAFQRLPTTLISLELPGVPLGSEALPVSHLTRLTELRAAYLDPARLADRRPVAVLPTSLRSLTLRDDWDDADAETENAADMGHDFGSHRPCPLAALAALLPGLTHLFVWRAAFGFGVPGSNDARGPEVPTPTPPPPPPAPPPLAGLRGLRSLHLGATELGNAAAGRCLSVLTGLTSLRCSLSGAEELPLAAMTRLEDAAVSGMAAGTWDALVAGGGLPRLRKLWLLSYGLTGGDDDDGGGGGGGGVGDAGAVGAVGQSAARDGVGGTGAAAGAAAVAVAAPLRQLFVRQQRYPSSCLKGLMRRLPPDLRSLELIVEEEDEDEDDPGHDLLYEMMAGGLVRVTELRTLKVNTSSCERYLGPSGRESSFRAVAEALPWLEDLDLQGSEAVGDLWVTDEALAVLGSRGRLRRLDLGHHRVVTVAGVEAVVLGCRMGRRSTMEVVEQNGKVEVTTREGLAVGGCPSVYIMHAERLRDRLPP